MGNRGQPGPVRVFGSLATVLLAGTHVANRIWVEGPISTLRRLQMALAGYVAVLGTTVVVAFRVPWNVLWRWSDRRYLCDDVTTNPQWLLTGGAAIVGSIVWFWIASFGQTRRANDELTAGGADVSSSSRRIPNRASQASAG